MFGDRQRGLIRGLIYPIQFDRDPLNGIDRVLDVVVARRALDADPADYAAAVTGALSSAEVLSELIPQPHPEPVIRAYLKELRKRLPGESLPAD